MRMGKTLLLSVIAAATLTSASMIRFETMSAPDLVEIKYGFPLFWLHRQTISITAPVDTWSVQWPSLVVDLVLWFTTSAAIVYALDIGMKTALLFCADKIDRSQGRETQWG